MVRTVVCTLTQHRITASPRLARLACPLPPTYASIANTRVLMLVITCSYACGLPKPNPQSPPVGVVTLRAGGHPRTHQTGLSCLISHTLSVCPRATTANSLWGSTTTRTRPDTNTCTACRKGDGGRDQKDPLIGLLALRWPSSTARRSPISALQQQQRAAQRAERKYSSQIGKMSLGLNLSPFG